MFFSSCIEKVRRLQRESLQGFSLILYKYAGYVYERPYKIIIISLMCCMFLTWGFHFKENERDMYKLYALSGSYAQETNQTINDFFYKSRKSFLMVEANFNLLEPEILRELKSFEESFKKLRVDMSEVVACKEPRFNAEEDFPTKEMKQVYELLDKKRENNLKVMNEYLEQVKILSTTPSISSESKEKEVDNDDIMNLYLRPSQGEKKKEKEKEKGRKDTLISEYENDHFYPYNYIPPMLEKGDYCNLKNVFKEKNLDIDLRKIDEKTKKNITFGIEDICVIIQGECDINSLFSYYEKGNAKFEDPIELEQFPYYINPKTNKTIIFNTLLGGIDKIVEHGKTKIIGANAILTILTLHNFHMYEPYVLAFEKKLIAHVTSYKIKEELLKNRETKDNEKAFIKFHIFTDRSVGDEVDRISRIDNLTRLLLMLGVLLIVLYTLFNNVTSVLYRSKPLCAIIGIFCGFLGFLSGSGFLYLLGVKSVPPAETVPFLVIGVGVDDIFVILNSYSLLFMIKDDKKRIQNCLRDSALSITVTTLTNIIAFLISAISPFYSICSFSLFTASSLFFGYLMVLTLFLSFLCIEAKLEKQKKSICSCIRDFFISLCRCCSKTPSAKNCIEGKPEKEEEPSAIVSDENGKGNEMKQNKTGKEEEEEEDPQSNRQQIDYENISIYEWIHNLYLFEESLKKKKHRHHIGFSDTIEMDEDEINIEQHNKDKDKKNKKKMNMKGKEKTSKCIIFDMKATKEDKRNRKEEKSIQNKKKDHPNNENYNENIEEDQGVVEKREREEEKEKEEKDQAEKHNQRSKNKSETENMNTLNTSIELATRDSRHNIVNETNKNIYLLSSHDNVLFYKYIYKEPKGNIGKYFRFLIKEYYVPALSSITGKILIYFIFTCIIGISIYGCTLMKKGIKYDKAFPMDSYVRQFSNARMKYFPEFGDYIEVCYFDKNFIEKYRKLNHVNSYSAPSDSVIHVYNTSESKEPNTLFSINRNIPWENAELQGNILGMYNQFQNMSFITYVFNGFSLFLQEHATYIPIMNNQDFYEHFKDWMDHDLLATMFKNDFIFLNGELVAWKFHYYQKNSEDTEILGKWLKHCKDIARIPKFNVEMVCFHFSSIFIETDEAIIDVTLKNLGVTVVAVLIVTAYVVKGIYSSIIITVIICLIDLCIFGYMCLFGITINIISMVILVLSVGFCIDHTSHIVQAFTHSIGRTRNEKMKESLHLMLGPVLHSGLSTWFVISTLFFSNKDFTLIFFQTLSLVLFFSIIFSTVFLPVLLSSIGPM